LKSSTGKWRYRIATGKKTLTLQQFEVKYMAQFKELGEKIARKTCGNFISIILQMHLM